MIRLGSFPGSPGGTGSFDLTSNTLPGNDLCSNAIAVAVPSITPGTTQGATTDTEPSCVQSNTSPGVWYSLVGTGTTLTASTCTGATAFDSKISVYCGTCTNLICIDGNDDACGLQSSVTWCSQAGATYLVLVHGFGGQTGTFELEIADSGTSCTPTIQCGVTGACCTGTGCIVTDAGTCASIGGTYQGDGTSCGGVTYTPATCIQQWENIVNVGTQLSLGDDDGVFVNIPFAFNYFGVDRTSIGISSNGFATFGTDVTTFSNVPIPDIAPPNGILAPMWDDFNPSAGGTIYYATTGVAPNRAFLVEWLNVPQFASTDANTFELILFENSNKISFRYLSVTPEAFPGDYSIGIENDDGTVGFSFPGTAAVNGACLEFLADTLPSSCPQPVQVDVTPGICPNPYNTESRGAVQVTIAGTHGFDVSQVLYNSVLLTRTDRIGVGVSPFEGPPGPRSTYEDVATPFFGPLGQCTTAGADGTMDLSMYFSAEEILANFQLTGMAVGTQIPVTVAGYLANGQWFQGEDMLTIIAPPPTVNLSVRSNLPDAWVEVWPRDVAMDSDGWTNFDRLYPQGTAVTLQAAIVPYGHFMGWRVNGHIVNPGNPVLNVNLSQSQTVWAVYQFVRTAQAYSK